MRQEHGTEEQTMAVSEHQKLIVLVENEVISEQFFEEWTTNVIRSSYERTIFGKSSSRFI